MNNMSSNAEILGFCFENIGNTVKVVSEDKTIYGKIVNVNINEVVLSKEENFYIVGFEKKKFSSKHKINISNINEISLVLDN